MSRDIKFRMWDKFQNKYIFEGYHVIGEITAFGGMEMVIHVTMKERHEKLGYKNTIEAWNDFIEEQYTGLKDKNGKGKDVYFGDIAKDEHGTIFEIIDDYDFMSHLSHIWFEIIGNIHEDLELLK